MPSMSKETDEQVTDVLAAEEFVVPASDPALRPEHLDLPPDQIGEEPHDVLAAEEFAMPAPDEAHEHPPGGRRVPLARLIAINLPPVLLALWLWRRIRGRAAAREGS
jgi:hypothetical protein